MRYKNPTLTEIYAEFHFEAGLLPDKALITLGHELATRGLDEQEFTQSLVKSEEPGKDATILPRIRCWDRDRTKLIQLSQNLVIVNLIGEYPGWSKFKEHAAIARDAIKKALKQSPSIKRIDFVAIDKWKVESATFSMARYFQCGGSFIPGWYSDVTVSSDISLGQGFHNRDGYNQNIKVAVRVSQNSADIQIVTTLGVTRSIEDPESVLDQLHSEAVHIFEGLITDTVRNEVMGGQV
jgi:hypothetical protein